MWHEIDVVQWVGGGALALAVYTAFRWINLIINERQQISKENRERRRDDQAWFEEALKSRDAWIDRLKHDHQELREQYDELRVIHEADATHFRDRLDAAESRERLCQARLSDAETQIEALQRVLKVDQQ